MNNEQLAISNWLAHAHFLLLIKLWRTRPSPVRDDTSIDHNAATRNCGINGIVGYKGRHNNIPQCSNAELWNKRNRRRQNNNQIRKSKANIDVS